MAGLAQLIFLGSAGIFAGMGYTLNVLVVPGLKKSADPVPAWKIVYTNGKNTAVPTIIASALTGLYLCLSTGVYLYLLSALLNLLVIPYTTHFMAPTNSAIFALKLGQPSEIEKGKRLITKWGELQWVRTILGELAFFIGAYATAYY